MKPDVKERYRGHTEVFLGHNNSPRLKGKKIANTFFFFSYLVKFQGGGGGERCVAARLGSSLCQGYKQAVIRPANRIILPVSAPKHMGPHKAAAAAPDRHPLLITQRRGAGPFLPVPFPSQHQCLSAWQSKGNRIYFRAGNSQVNHEAPW